MARRGMHLDRCYDNPILACTIDFRCICFELLRAQYLWDVSWRQQVNNTQNLVTIMGPTLTGFRPCQYDRTRSATWKSTLESPTQSRIQSERSSYKLQPVELLARGAAHSLTSVKFPLNACSTLLYIFFTFSLHLFYPNSVPCIPP